MSTHPDLEVVNFECNLTIAARSTCECSAYLLRRRHVLIPAVLKEADRRGEDAVDVFAEYARKVHAKKCEAQS